MAYLYETHMHTCQGSACGVSTGREHVRYYQDRGYTGIIITDHFLGGNTAVPRDLPWSERIRIFCSGYEDARNEGEKIGLDVFFGWEQNYAGDEYLIYGPQPEWLLAHPEIEICSRAEQLKLIHEAGGVVIQAHPFRVRPYIPRVLLGLRYCDGIEAANAGNPHGNDAAAYAYALEYGLVMTAGSDNHHSHEPGDRSQLLFGIETDERLTSTGQLAKMLLSGRQPGLQIPEGHFEQDAVDAERIVSFWLDEYELAKPTERDWLG